MIETQAEDAQRSAPVFLERNRVEIMQPFPDDVCPAEGDGEKGEEFADLRGIGHVRVLKAEAPGLETPEERLDFPPLEVRFHGMLSGNVRDDDEELVLQSRAGEEQTVAADEERFLERPHLSFCQSPEEILHVALPCPGDQEVLPDADDEGDLLSAQPCEPRLPHEFPVGEETGDVLLPQKTDHGAQDLLPLCSGGVSFLREEHPGDREGGAPVDDGNREDVDVGLPPLPVRAVHREPVRSRGEEGKDKRHEEFLRNLEGGEESLDAAVAGSCLRFPAEGQSDLREVHRPDGDEGEDELGEELETLSAEGKVNT